jgi:serine/threonine protein phosphatase PrpC
MNKGTSAQMAVASSGRMPARFTWRSSAATSTGNVRSHNEDSILELPEVGLWCIADGMGGHNAGDVASRMIVEALATVARHSRPSALVDEVEDRICDVNSRLHRAATRGGMSGSTVAVLLALERHVISLWAGDSRVYRSREGQLVQLTRDHSDVQEMLDGGLITPENAARMDISNVITRAVGGTSELYLDVELSELRDGDRFLICSDGLYRELAPEVLAKHLAVQDPAKACKGLMKQALEGVCSDNISAIVVQFTAA